MTKVLVRCQIKWFQNGRFWVPYVVNVLSNSLFLFYLQVSKTDSAVGLQYIYDKVAHMEKRQEEWVTEEA